MIDLMDYTKFVQVKCDWLSNVDGKEIEDCLVTRLQQSEHETVEIDIWDLLEKSNCKCVNFAKPDEQNDLFINISCSPKYSISHVFVCSEAKIVESFGKTGEYVSTHSAFSSQDDNEFPMNCHSIRINSSECSLKFGQLKNPEFVWIYGVLVYLIKTKNPTNKTLGPINMQNVQNLLNPETLVTNASKLFSTLSLKESKSDHNDVLKSILNDLENSKILNSSNDSQFMLNSFQQFEKNVEDKLNTLQLQLNIIGSNVETLNTKFDVLLNALHEKKML